MLFLTQCRELGLQLRDTDAAGGACRAQRLHAVTAKVHAVRLKYGGGRQVFRHNETDGSVAQMIHFLSFGGCFR